MVGARGVAPRFPVDRPIFGGKRPEQPSPGDGDPPSATPRPPQPPRSLLDLLQHGQGRHWRRPSSNRFGSEGNRHWLIPDSQSWDWRPLGRIATEDVVANGDKVVARVRYSGTNRGEFLGMAATGKSVDVQLIDMFRFGDDGLLREHWGVLDALAMMQQLGVVPAGLPF